MQSHEHPRPSIVVIVSAVSEWRVVLDALAPEAVEPSPAGEWFRLDHPAAEAIILHGGWGKIAAAASAQYAIDRWRAGAIVNIGTCGGLAGRTTAGVVIIAERTVVTDLSVEIGDVAEEEAFYATELGPSPKFAAGLPWPVVAGTIASGDRDVARSDVERLSLQYDAVAGDWESASIAFVARRNGVRCFILRGVSDVVSAAHADAYDGRDHVFHTGVDRMMRMFAAGLPAVIAAAACEI